MSSDNRDAALQRLLHDLRSGVVGIGAVVTTIHARLGASPVDVDKMRRELELIERTVDGLDRIIASARALLTAPPRS